MLAAPIAWAHIPILGPHTHMKISSLLFRVHMIIAIFVSLGGMALSIALSVAGSKALWLPLGVEGLALGRCFPCDRGKGSGSSLVSLTQAVLFRTHQIQESV